MSAPEKVTPELEELLEVTDVADALASIGRPYDTVMKYVKLMNRLDLAIILRNWKIADTKRLNQALGRHGIR